MVDGRQLFMPGMSLLGCSLLINNASANASERVDGRQFFMLGR